MKYLKKFENERYGALYYNVGDYVLGNWKYNKLSKIILDNNKNYRSYDYIVESLIEDTETFEKDMIDEEQIERKLTSKEIEKFDLIKDTKKYNL